MSRDFTPPGPGRTRGGIFRIGETWSLRSNDFTSSNNRSLFGIKELFPKYRSVRVSSPSPFFE